MDLLEVDILSAAQREVADSLAVVSRAYSYAVAPVESGFAVTSDCVEWGHPVVDDQHRWDLSEAHESEWKSVGDDRPAVSVDRGSDCLLAGRQEF